MWVERVERFWISRSKKLCQHFLLTKRAINGIRIDELNASSFDVVGMLAHSPAEIITYRDFSLTTAAEKKVFPSLGIELAYLLLAVCRLEC